MAQAGHVLASCFFRCFIGSPEGFEVDGPGSGRFVGMRVSEVGEEDGMAIAMFRSCRTEPRWTDRRVKGGTALRCLQCIHSFPLKLYR